MGKHNNMWNGRLSNGKFAKKNVGTVNPTEPVTKAVAQSLYAGLL